MNESTYGIDSSAVADILRGLASVYLKEQNLAKSESTMLRAVSIYENNYGDEDPHVSIARSSLCYIYDQWGKPDKSAPCHARMVSMAERQFGPDSAFLVQDLTAEAKLFASSAATKKPPGWSSVRKRCNPPKPIPISPERTKGPTARLRNLLLPPPLNS